MQDSTLSHDSGHDVHHDHEVQSFWSKYVFSTDHKVIGIQYAITSMLSLLGGFMMMILMRWQLAYPGEAIPLVGNLLENIVGKEMMADGVMQAQFYNSLGAMHGTVMIFLGVVPLGFAAFGNYVMPLQVGAPDMAFPRLNMASYWTFLPGALIMFLSFFVPGGAAKSGWTSYSPLATVADPPQAPTIEFFSGLGLGPDLALFMASLFNGQSLWLIAMIFLITSSLLGSVNVIVTVIQLRARGMEWMRMPYFVWVTLVTAFLLLLAFPPLEAAGIMQLMDRVAFTSFFMPSGLYVGGETLNSYAGGGSPLLWQHLFWFLGHPEVYIMLLPSIGIVAEIIACNTRKPLWGYRSLVVALIVLGGLSFIVWAHHMYMTGMGSKVSAFFQTTTTIISIPSVIILSALLISLWGGSIRFNTPMLFATAFLPMFGIGGLTGIPLAFNSLGLYLHDTYYVIGHFHYVVAPGVMFGLFAGIYHWYPKATGRMMNETLGKLHFWPTLICMNLIFGPMFIQGMAGMHRRWYDGGASYELAAPVLHWNVVMTIAAFVMLVAQFPFIWNFFTAWKWGRPAGLNPWQATTLDWQTPFPVPHGNFDKPVVVYRGPYEYSVPGHETDFTPQNQPDPVKTTTPV
ncbi:MAG: cbb3-type cytochrome c oxidase subunit I [Candidatus Methylacidiphilales bacterium]